MIQKHYQHRDLSPHCVTACMDVCCFQSNWYLILLQFDYHRYQLMLNCWSEFADKRPTFPDLVREFDRMITMLSDKVNVIRRMTKNIFAIPPTFEEFFQLFNSNYQTCSITAKRTFIQHTYTSYSKSQNMLFSDFSQRSVTTLRDMWQIYVAAEVFVVWLARFSKKCTVIGTQCCPRNMFHCSDSAGVNSCVSGTIPGSKWPQFSMSHCARASALFIQHVLMRAHKGACPRFLSRNMSLIIGCRPCSGDKTLLATYNGRLCRLFAGGK